ncbi:hypothetical protein BJ973_008041 [Actinoplanes tereljensis]|uniref:Uncharacterized protein n=1 Tax=Paractinoplanes tereljensis TaxID=571912 RepID=A0A919TY56_9ACTN|nr:hypothetical protein [Actinoplanes tereljensis]GIF24562.1 hypothetical protein Ate02nite_72920 [Actinoplanes tereljensis]
MADGVRVETDGLTKFSDQVQNDTTSTLGNGYSRARVDLSTGVEFGSSNASGAVFAAKQRYRDSLLASTANVQAYLDAAEVLALAAGKVAKAMDETDGRAAQRATEIRTLLDQAVVEARQRRAPADGESAA